MTRIRFIVVGTVLILATLACNFPGSNPTPEPPGNDDRPVVTQPASQTATVEPTAPPAEEPSPTPRPSAATPAGIELNYKGFRFTYPGEIFAGFQPQVAPADLGVDPGGIGWIGSIPDRIEVKATGYLLSNTFLQPELTLYPIQEYAKINPAAGDISGRLSLVLGEDPLPGKNLPFMPMFNAGQVFAARAEKFAFQNGEGIRYLTCYSQAILPIDSACLFYTYQGLTSDGRYYLSAIFPVSLPVLDSSEMQKTFETATQNYDQAKYDAYVDRAIEMISQSEPGDFIPNLDSLDGVVRSVSAQPEIDLLGPAVSIPACPEALAARLRPDITARVTYTDGTPLRVRQSPGKTAPIAGQLPEGTQMTVTGGPQCVAGGYWWNIRVTGGSGLEGWVLEGENGSYFVEPWQ